MNEQRKVIYGERRTILEGEDHADEVQRMIDDVVSAYVDGATAEGYAEDWDVDELWRAMRTLYPLDSIRPGLPHRHRRARDDVTPEELRDALLDDAHKAYAAREAEIDQVAGEGAMRQLERSILLNVIDRSGAIISMRWIICAKAFICGRWPSVIRSPSTSVRVTTCSPGCLRASRRRPGFLYNAGADAGDRARAVADQACAGAEVVGGGCRCRRRYGVRGQSAPAALRASGADQSTSASGVIYTGPAEDGGVETLTDEQEEGDPGLAAALPGPPGRQAGQLEESYQATEVEEAAELRSERSM